MTKVIIHLFIIIFHLTTLLLTFVYKGNEDIDQLSDRIKRITIERDREKEKNGI